MLSTGSTHQKDPNASAWPRGIDWTKYLADLAGNETITTSTWTIEDGDVATSPGTVLTTSSPTIVTGSLKTQVKLSAGTLGQNYRLVNSIITSSGVHDTRSITIAIRKQ